MAMDSAKLARIQIVDKKRKENANQRMIFGTTCLLLVASAAVDPEVERRLGHLLNKFGFFELTNENLNRKET